MFYLSHHRAFFKRKERAKLKSFSLKKQKKNPLYFKFPVPKKGGIFSTCIYMMLGEAFKSVSSNFLKWKASYCLRKSMTISSKSVRVM